MKKIYYSFVFFLIVHLLPGCKGTTTTQVMYTGDAIPGTIIGKVTAIDTLFINGRYVVSDPSGVEVSIEGTSLKGITDKGGRYSISNVPPGAYWLIFKKEDFATYHDGVIEFAGNGTDYWDAEVYRISYVTPDLVLRPFDSAGNTTFTFKVLDSLQSNEQVTGYTFFSKTDAISPSDPNSYVLVFPIRYISSQPSIGNFSLSIADLKYYGFDSGDKIYCVTYSGKNSTDVSYRDLATYKRIYTGFSPYTSGVKSFILP
jgi:hypothetical protein